jgi:extracellular elastinolytic metalloproteinase
MAGQLDKRDFGYVAVPGTRGVAEEIPDLDPFTGSIRRFESSTADFGEQSTRLKAIELAHEASAQVSRFIESEPAEFGLPRDVTLTSAGAEIVHLQQLHKGVPVFQSGRTVHFRTNGQASVTGTTVEALTEAESDPTLDARSAVIEAAKFVSQGDDDESSADTDTDAFGGAVAATIELPDEFDPVQTATFDLPAHPTTFVAEPFEGPIKASLVYLYMGPEARLTWQVELVFPNAAADYAVLVAAGENNPGEILYSADRVCHLLGVCEVHPHNPGETARVSTNFPLPADTLPGTLNQAPPAQHWIGDQPRTSGNDVVCRGDSLGVVSGDLDGDVVTFGPFQPKSDEDHVAHTFYFCNVMHDFFEALGFDEAAGNFQQTNHSGAPGGGDPVEAIVFEGAVQGTASMATPPDGQSPTMRMGLVTATNNHTALDSDVVFHEFVHGVTNRLVGGRLDQTSLGQAQSRGMGEGWSDYFALSFQNVGRPADRVAIGDWVVDKTGGIRKFPYDNSFPDGFGALGTGRYTGGPHAIGEIWCATLTKATRDLGSALDDKPRAYAIAWQSVVDGLKVTAANPSFLDARDAIADAIEDLKVVGLITEEEHRKTRQAFWKAFVHFEMGTNASSLGASLSGIAGDKTLPDDVAAEIEV